MSNDNAHGWIPPRSSARRTKSPIKNLPVRQPGQSIRERIDALFDDKIVPYVFASVMIWIVALLDWCWVWFPQKRSPWVFTFFAAAMTYFSICRIRSWGKSIKALKLGQIGEEAVGQFLEERLIPLGYNVLHDIPAEGFNIDHAVIGPTGIFAIETKTRSKPEKGFCVVSYDGKAVAVDGNSPDRDPIVQAKSEAFWLGDLLAQSTGRSFFVQPVVLFPGWFIEQRAPIADVWVLNEKAAPTFIKNGKGKLSPEDISLITFHLKRYVIAHDNRPIV